MLYQNTFQNLEEPAQARISCFGYRNEKGGNFPLHCHAYYEICYLVSGERYEFYDGVRYEVKAGSLFLIPPLHVHGYQNREDCNDLVIQFSNDFLYNVSPAFNKSHLLSLTDGELPFLMISKEDPIAQLLEKLYQLRHYDKVDSLVNNTAMDWETVSLLMQLLSAMLGNGKLRITDGSVQYSEIPQLTEIINRFLSKPDQKLDMHEASKIIGISYYHFSRFFKKVTGMGYSEYCNLLRIHYTEDLLINTNMTITEIAGTIGIDSNNYYSRLFKQINGVSPRQYRQKYSEKSGKQKSDY